MQKWEYLTLVSRIANDDWRAQTRDSVVLKDWEKGPTLVQYLNQLGNEGWELVSETFDRSVNQYARGAMYVDNEMKKWQELTANLDANGYELASSSAWTNGGRTSGYEVFFQKPYYDAVRRFILKRPRA